MQFYSTLGEIDPLKQTLMLGRHMKYPHQLLNFLGFQLGWWACVLSVRYDLEYAAILFAMTLCMLQLFSVENRIHQLKLIAWVLPLGVALDTGTQLLLGWTFYGWSFDHLSPFWLWMIWALFALTLKSSMVFLQALPFIAQAALGFVFGPLSYIGGAQLGAASFHWEPLKLLTLALAWALITPLLVKLSSKID
jgi:hypothetical protein